MVFLHRCRENRTVTTGGFECLDSSSPTLTASENGFPLGKGVCVSGGGGERSWGEGSRPLALLGNRLVVENLQLVPLGTTERKAQKEKPVKQAMPQLGPGSRMGRQHSLSGFLSLGAPLVPPHHPSVPHPGCPYTYPAAVHTLTGCWAPADTG